ncbi:ESF1 homolog [Culicoides brevitarsis]|uniref:ESF1 homolog n=1 Tax=Culicoides brevitarsis TaxID=469753 RepID=UPI00307B77D2
MAKDDEKTEKIWSDPRFAHLVNDPRFKGLPKSQKKVKIDKRFQSMFENDKFKLKYNVDKRGRKVNTTTTEDLKKYYDLSSENETDEEEEKRKEQKAIEEQSESEEEETAETDEFGNSTLDRGDIAQDIKSKLKNLDIDYARGEAALLSDSSSDEESSEEEDPELMLDHVWGELDADAPRTDESTRRIAACNMDWDRIRAVDIMVLCHSFLPPGGVVQKVSIYPSEFGKERLKEEEITGPKELIESANRDSDNEIDAKEEDAEESEYQREKLREYQLNRLKYYYAVIECDSVATADKLYAECDGMEYESTACKLDFRFIPDDVTFDEDEPRDVCTELPDLAKYKPRLFTTKALQQGKVELTWDENDMERKEIQEKLLNGDLQDVPDDVLKKYVACSSSEGESEAENEEKSEESSESEVEEVQKGKKNKKSSIEKYKSLLNEINQQEEERKKQQIEREFTWGIGVESDLNAKKSQKSKDNLTPFEKILEKKKEKRKERKEERKRRKKGSEDDSDSDIPDGIDMNDPYFAEEFANNEFEKPAKAKKDKKSKKPSVEDDEDQEAKNAQLSLLLADGDDDNRAHFSLKKIQAMEDETKPSKAKRKFKKKKLREIQAEKEKLKAQDDFNLNLADDRFKAVFSKPEFNIDPTNPQFKKTKNMDALIQEKLKRKDISNENGNETEDSSKRPKLDPEVSAMMKSIKRKIKDC